MMTQKDLPAQIAATKEAIRDAENELQRLLANPTVAPRGEKGLAREAVRAATSTLRVAEAKLIDLDKLFALAKIDAATTAIDEAKSDLVKVLDAIVVVPEDTMVTAVVKDALARLRDAQMRLDELEKAAATDKI